MNIIWRETVKVEGVQMHILPLLHFKELILNKIQMTKSDYFSGAFCQLILPLSDSCIPVQM